MKTLRYFGLSLAFMATMMCYATTITFISDGNKYCTKEISKGSKYVFPTEPALSPFSLTFAGWSTTNAGDPHFVTEEDVVENDITLYAYWIKGEAKYDTFYKLVTSQEELTPSTQFAIVAESTPYSLVKYTGWKYVVGQRYYSGGRKEMVFESDSTIMRGFADNFYYDASKTSLKSADYTNVDMFANFDNDNCPYLGYPYGAYNRETEIYGSKVFTITVGSDSLATIKVPTTAHGTRYLGYSDEVVDAEKGLYFHFTSDEQKVRLYKQVLKLLPGNEFVSSSENYLITTSVDSKSGNIDCSSSSVAYESEGFRVLKGESITLTANCNKELPEELGKTDPNLYYKPVWTTSDGKYTDYKASSITLTPAGNITVSVDFVVDPASITINGEKVSATDGDYTSPDGSIEIKGDQIILNNANLNEFAIDYPSSIILINGNCTVNNDMTLSGSAYIVGEGNLNINGSLTSTGGGELNISSSVKISANGGIKKTPSKVRRAGSLGSSSVISGFDEFEYSSNFIMISPIAGKYNAKSKMLVDSKGEPATELRIIDRSLLDLDGDGELNVTDVTYFIKLLLNDTGIDGK